MGLQTEIGDIIAETVCDASVMEGKGSKHYAKQIIAKMREVVEGAELTDQVIEEAIVGASYLVGATVGLTHHQKIAEAQLQAILKAMED